VGLRLSEPDQLNCNTVAGALEIPHPGSGVAPWNGIYRR
jgi:hypothetical protein